MKVLFSRYLGNIEQSWGSVNEALPNLMKRLPEPEAGQENKGIRDVLQFVLETNEMRVILILMHTFPKVVFLVALAAWECFPRFSSRLRVRPNISHVNLISSPFLNALHHRRHYAR